MATVYDLFNCAGWKAMNRIGVLTEMHNIFQQNDLEVQNLFKLIHDNVGLSKDVYKESWNHLPQRIFNYLVSSAALIDHTRKMMAFYKNDQIYSKYEDKVSEIFSENECANFVKKLRNYQTHFRIEIPTPVRSLENNKFWDVILISEELLAHPKEWDKKSKQFIEKCGKEINLNKVFSEYTNMVNLFYTWLYNELMQHHKNDFREKENLEKQLNIDTEALKSELAKIVG